MSVIPYIARIDDEGAAVLFFPTAPANFGNIVCYQHIGQHGEASDEWRLKDTRRPRNEVEKLVVRNLVKEYRGFLKHGEKLRPMQRDTYAMRMERWKRG